MPIEGGSEMPEAVGRFPVISIVGKSDSGKTTLIEKLVRLFVSRGYRVATVKHHKHSSEIDVPGKDTWRHCEAGASEVVLGGKSKVAVFRPVEEPEDLDTLLTRVESADIVFTEGFNEGGRVIVEVCRKARSRQLINPPARLFAVATDNVIDAEGVPVFHLDEAAALADLIESTYLPARMSGRASR